jgi:hypothetical protein
VERALTLVATGTLTIAMARAAKGKTVTLPRTMNHTTGKESMRQTGFSDASWGKVSRSYTKSACGLGEDKFDSVIRDAQQFVKPIRARNRTTDAVEVDEEDDERACLIDYPGSESDCE